ncbi:MAG: hydantoinase B/oxoprolinase family protein, partial [Geminicoccales bacterium]
SEARMRARIAELPDGEYYYEDYLETFVEGGRLDPLLLPLRLTVRGEELIADFTGASPQAPAPVNSTRAVTAAAVLITLKSVLDPAAPLNHGSFRPVTVITPERTVVNVQHPAPAGSHGELRKRAIAVMLGALSQVVPERVSGDVHRTSFQNNLGGIHPATGREYVHYEWSSGGNGAFAEADGASAMAAIDWGDLSTAQPTEVLESRYPLLIEWSRLGADSGGDGRRRGGLGMRRGLRLLAAHASYSLLSDGAVVPPFGVLGGQSAAPVDSFVIRDGREVRFATPGKVGGFELQRDDLLVLQSAGGGGYGDPLERPVEEILDDVREGYVTAGHAEEAYGLVLRGDLSVDRAATERRRHELRAARVYLTVADSERDLYRPGRLSRRRICPLNPADALVLRVDDGDMVEILGTRGAPLRAWVELDRDLTAGTVPLDPLACAAIGAAPGAAVHLRRLRKACVV